MCSPSLLRATVLSIAILVAACGDSDDAAERSCATGDSEACYSGSSGTENVGICIAGTRICNADGEWGDCTGEVVPSVETCLAIDDEDCDGQINESGDGCSCAPGEIRDCYTAEPLTEGVGICLAGLETCTDDGTGFGECADEVTPEIETCETLEDDDCDGLANEDGNLCICTPGEIRTCYTGPIGTEGIGICLSGMETCLADGTGFGACEGEQVPMAELCDGLDNDCNAVLDDPPDIDGDGWNACEGDCCETTVDCSIPENVNPGAFEFVGNEVDDDCDPLTSDVVAATACSSLAKFDNSSAVEMAGAMELCQATTEDLPLAARKWGLISAEFRNADGSSPNGAGLNTVQDFQTAVLTDYGTGGIVPRMGDTMAGLSTGRMRDQNDPDYENPSGGSNFGRDSTPPAVYLAANGGALPASASCNGNCPAGSGANDSVNLRLVIRVPTNARSFSYDFRFFSAEYWTYSCTVYNDFYLALLQSEASDLPADRNISFDSVGNPVSVNNGFFDVCVAKGCYTCPGGSAPLAGTGMQLGNTGGGTPWLQTTAPVVPGEIIVLELMVFDVSDNILDSNVLLDGFEWSIEESSVGTGPPGPG